MTYDLRFGGRALQGAGRLSDLSSSLWPMRCNHTFSLHYLLAGPGVDVFAFGESLCLKKSTLDAALAFLLFFTIEDVRGLGVDMGLFR